MVLSLDPEAISNIPASPNTGPRRLLFPKVTQGDCFVSLLPTVGLRKTLPLSITCSETFQLPSRLNRPHGPPCHLTSAAPEQKAPGVPQWPSFLPSPPPGAAQGTTQPSTCRML